MKQNSINRRSFIHHSAIGTGLLITSAKTALTAEANSALSVGLIGCGGRGFHDASNIKRVSSCQITALADPFTDRLESMKRRLQADSATLHEGMDGYQALLQTDVDAVIITSPPYFHPRHFEAAVEAGKHVYMEKPVATSTFDTLRVKQAGEKGAGKLSMMVGFQNRYNPKMQAAVKRIHNGALGTIVCGDGNYHSGKLGPQSQSGMDEKEAKLRDWLFDQVLSGDILVEQNIHVLDVCNWIMQTHPISAYGKGGQKIRTDYGDTWDHFEVIYTYPNNVNLTFSSTQFMELGWGDAGERFNGSDGVFENGPHWFGIRGPNAWEGNDIQAEDGMDDEKLKMLAFCNSIVQGDYINEIPSGVDSTLTAILGRTAAYRKQEHSWDEMLNEKEQLKSNWFES